MGTYELEHIDFSFGDNTVLQDLNLSFETGHFYGIIGPNGSGKTTLIDLLAGHLRPDAGEVRFNGRCLTTYSRKSLARQISLVPQDFRINFPYTCGEVVMMGRYPHIPRFSRPTDNDRKRVAAVMRQASLETFVNRYITQLSGGERQRVVFARSLAQDTPVLLLDEATSNLDMQHTIGLLNLAAGKVNPGTVVISVMQDVNIAAMYCDRLVCMRKDGEAISGPVDDVLTADTLRDVFQVNTHVDFNAYANARQVAFKKELC